MKRKGDKTHAYLDQRQHGMTWLLTIDTITDFRLAVERLNGKQQLTINAYSILLQNLPKFISRTQSYAFSRSTKYAKRFLPYFQDFSKICFRVKNWSVVLRPGRKPHFPSSNLDSTISRYFLSRHIGTHYSW